MMERQCDCMEKKEPEIPSRKPAAVTFRRRTGLPFCRWSGRRASIFVAGAGPYKSNNRYETVGAATVGWHRLSTA